MSDITTPREAVAMFACRMEEQLQLHENKGNWNQAPLRSLLSRAHEKLDEIDGLSKKAAKFSEEKVPTHDESWQELYNEVRVLTADVGNYAMILADNLGLLSYGESKQIGNK